MRTVPRSLVLATDIEVLPEDRIVTREGDHLIVRSPSNPQHWDGNLLVFDDAPQPGDGARWEAAFAAAFAAVPEVRHRLFAWDRTDGAVGAAALELTSQGFKLAQDVGLVAAPAEIVPHPRANREVEIRALDPAGDGALWEGAVTVAVENNAADPSPEPDFARFAGARQAERRARFAAGRGAWYVAIDHADGCVVAGCGIVVTGSRARFQAVDTAPAHRRRGIATRLVAEAAAHAAAHHPITQLVIVADKDYHALGIYESLGFRACERVCQAIRPPPPPPAA
jgi:ribosomal protein S18 acetylase RimI-like enzyme